ncbi:MAG TPA: HAD family phosphatase [Candidatus Gemmiger faecigallinarum]|nr:HAD family phosphatase [Candidatus Gemmiger faecigallinarum]
MIQGVIFDMDGLMFDTERIWATLWAPALERLGQPAPSDAFIAGARGLAGENMLRYLAENYPACDPQQLLDVVNELGRTALANGAPAKPGLYELLDWLEQASIPRVVASSSTRGTIDRYLRIADIERYFAARVSGDDVQFSKPDPAIFLTAAQALGLPPQNCLVLEDSFNGVRAGHAAGAVTVMVPDLTPPTPEIRALCAACCSTLLDVRDMLAAGRL